MAGAPGTVRTVRDHLALLRRRLPLIVVLTAVGALAALAVSVLQSPRYTSAAEVLVPQEPLTIEDPVRDQRIDQRRLDPARVLQDELRFADSAVVRDEAARRLGRGVQVSVTATKDADVLVFTGTSGSAADAAANAATAADAYVALRTDAARTRTRDARAAVDAQISAIDARLADLGGPAATGATGGTTVDAATGERAALTEQRNAWLQQRSLLDASGALVDRAGAVPQVITPAPVPGSATSPTTARNIVLGGLAGLIVGLVAAYVVDAADDRVRDADDLAQRTGLTVLGAVPAAATAAPATAGEPAGGEPDGLRLVPVADPLVAGATAGLGLTDADARVLLVPAGTPARRVRQVAEVLAATGVPPAAAVLVDRPAR